MKYDGVIFDLDGTILNTLPDLTESVNYALKEYGYKPRTIMEIRSFVGNGVGLLVKRALPQNTSDEISKKCLDTFKTHYKNNFANKTVPYDNICEVMKKITDNGIKIGIVSNKFDSAVQQLCEKFFSGLYTVAVGEKDGIPRKPAPDSTLYAISKLCINKEKILYIGDSEVDIQTAKNAGLNSLSVTWGFKDKEFLIENGAENTVDSPENIPNFLNI